MGATCEICGKKFKTTQGLRGHRTFVHQMTNSSGKSAAPLATEQELSKLKDRLDKLEGSTGVSEPSELERLLGITDKPLAEQVNQLTEQVNQLTEQVKRHDIWLTDSRFRSRIAMRSEHPVFLDDIADLRRQLQEYQPIINWIKKKWNLTVEAKGVGLPKY